MKIRIPNWCVAALDWFACAILPPPLPTRFKIRGYAVTQLDLALAGYGVLLAIASAIYYHTWLAIPAVALGIIGGYALLIK
jgi:hypothetical protein